jgi:hypothetical protein
MAGFLGIDPKTLKMVIVAGLAASAIHFLGFYNLATVHEFALTAVGAIDGLGAWLLLNKDI